MSGALLQAGAPSSAPGSGLLFFSTRQGRQSNCLLTVEAARFVAEALGRRLVLPPCASSPLGEQACAAMPHIPSQRQQVVHFPLTKVLQARDLSRCRAPPGGGAGGLLMPTDLPLSASLRNATCLHIGRGGEKPSACDKELADDPGLRALLGLRFTHQLSVEPEELRAGRASEALRSLRGDVYLHSAFSLFSYQVLGRHFETCALPREAEAVARMGRQLERLLGLSRASALCVHWRAEDFHHASKLRLHPNNTAADVSARALAAARSVGASQVLLLSNARYEGLHEAMDLLSAGGLQPLSPRSLHGTAFGCGSSYIYGPFAEMHLCSRCRAFVGTRRSTFTAHIEAMRAALPREARGGGGADPDGPGAAAAGDGARVERPRARSASSGRAGAAARSRAPASGSR